MSKTLFQSELSKLGPVTVEVTSDTLKSKFDGKPDFVCIKLDFKSKFSNLSKKSVHSELGLICFHTRFVC